MLKPDPRIAEIAKIIRANVIDYSHTDPKSITIDLQARTPEECAVELLSLYQNTYQYLITQLENLSPRALRLMTYVKPDYPEMLRVDLNCNYLQITTEHGNYQIEVLSAAEYSANLLNQLSLDNFIYHNRSKLKLISKN